MVQQDKTFKMSHIEAKSLYIWQRYYLQKLEGTHNRIQQNKILVSMNLALILLMLKLLSCWTILPIKIKYSVDQNLEVDYDFGVA